MKLFRNRLLLLVAFVMLLSFATSVAVAGERGGTVAAAASLQSMLAEIIPWFNDARGAELEGVFGASGNLARQIETGAPFDLFLSADEQWARYAEEKGLLDGRKAGNRLIIGGDVLKTGLAAKSGAADLAILPLSTAASLDEGSWTLLDAAPQTLFGGLVKGRSSAAAAELWEFIRSAEALPFFEKYGFMAP